MEFTMGGQLTIRVEPSDVGKRVSLRTATGDGKGRSPRFTDTVGVLTSWADGTISVVRRDGRTVHLAESALVAGKVVPAAPARRRGLPAAGVRELAEVAARGWPAPETGRIGDWTVRAAGGWTGRANSAYRSGDGPPDLDRIGAWYADRGLPARLQVTTGAAGTDELLDAALDREGWRAERHAVVLVAALAPLADREPDSRVVIGPGPDDRWLEGCSAARHDPAMARRVLAAGPWVRFAAVAGDDEAPAAVGRCVVDGRWAGFAALEVAARHRGKGLAGAVLGELARAALAEGASAAHLQVETDNAPARALYERLGFAEHHHYHYRVNFSALKLKDRASWPETR
ncbi:GNAT family N-acetyltransferase [Streptomyces sodiiphilus]|uniref:GNAT family N-acetyltransferase n=1 Tax=Streptomyces sodiiphilus TaxID=226217 RepID=A0ABP5A5R8_9ACTN